MIHSIGHKRLYLRPGSDLQGGYSAAQRLFRLHMYEFRILKLTSNCSGVMALYCAEMSLVNSPNLLPSPTWAFIRSAMKTLQAVEGTVFGALRHAFSFKSFTFSFCCFAALAAFCLSVATFLFDFGFAAAFFLGLGLGLSLGLALDFALGIVFGAVLSGAGFFAALVAEVVGALLCVAVVRPVWAFGRDTGLSAYEREDSGDIHLGLRRLLALLLGARRMLSAGVRSLTEYVTTVRRVPRR